MILQTIDELTCPDFQPRIFVVANFTSEGAAPHVRLGQKQTSQCVCAMSALPPKADIHSRDQDVCFGPIADIGLIKAEYP
jgi:hypothetical protein